VTAGSLLVSKGGIHLAKKTKKAAPLSREAAGIKSFLDMIAPSVVKFEPDHFICGNTFRCVWALREYPTQTDEQAILRHLGEKDGITLRIYTRQVTPAEEKRIIQNAANKNRMGSSNTNDLQQTITAESNLQDVASLVASMHRNREPLLHCAVYIELTASDYNTLKLLQTDVLTELVRSKLNVDRLLLRQQQGFCCASPVGYNAFGQQFERVLPASSVANLYPFNYSGKTDAKGFYVGRDKYGSNILVDFDQRDEDKTSANILILGNSGQGKSYLMKLLILNLLESGKSVITLDAEHEQQEMCEAVGGCFADLMAGKYIINALEPKCWDDGGDPDDTAAPEAFRKSTLLAQHVSFLKDFFRAYKDFSDAHIDTIEIMVSKLYAKWGITERTNFRRMRPEDYPILSDLYDLIEEEFKRYDPNAHLLYTEKLLQEVLLGLHSMCKGADAQFFNGHTNLTSSRFLVFGVKGMLSAAKNVRNAMLFNVLSFMSDKLLTVGNTVAALDELYIWLSNPTAIEYIRNCLKRVRKKESAMLLASQNLEDFDQEGIREMTKPLFSIPPHQFLFNAGSIDKRSYMEMLQLDEAEYNLIKFPQRGVCLYKCGNERYLLEVHAPTFIQGKAVWHGGWSLMAVSAGMIAKAAATVLSNEKLRKGVGWTLVAILSPIIVLIALLCSIGSGGADHNNQAVAASFYGVSYSTEVPAEFRHHIEEMRTAFSLLDSAVASVNGQTESGNGLDPIRIKAVFYALCFGEDAPSARAAKPLRRMLLHLGNPYPHGRHRERRWHGHQHGRRIHRCSSSLAISSVCQFGSRAWQDDHRGRQEQYQSHLFYDRRCGGRRELQR
jgi:hypothetical protein